MARKQHTNSIDGFTVRRRSTARPIGQSSESLPAKFLRTTPIESPPISPSSVDQSSQRVLRRSDIDESLQQFDEQPKKKRRYRLSKRFFKRLILALFIIALLVGGYLGVKAFLASNKIFGGNLFDILNQAQPLKEDENGRSNIVLFGTSEDDQFDHDGASLTDSIMLMSVDQKRKTAAMTSVPRDLWVKLDDDCQFGYQAKINTVYQCSRGDNIENTEEGAVALRKKVGEIYGLDVQYSIKVGYKAVQEAVDAVGGVTVTIESQDPRGILDRNFDWECRYQCYYVKYPNGTAQLDGKRALALARARGDDNGQATYGLSRGNFDREINQQKILLALKEKAVSTGTLANPVAASKLIDALGDNIRTNFVAGEIKTLIKLGNDIKPNNIQKITTIDDESPVLTTDNYQGQSIVRPVDGLFDYTGLQTYIRQKLTSDAAAKENASVTVLNGSGREGAAGEMKKKLTEKGLRVVDIGNAPVSAEYGIVGIYKLSDIKQPATTKKLTKILGVDVKKGPLPYGMTASSDFVVIVGE
jgi:LCP family protein required for cell wall assembly